MSKEEHQNDLLKKKEVYENKLLERADRSLKQRELRRQKRKK